MRIDTSAVAAYANCASPERVRGDPPAAAVGQRLGVGVAGPEALAERGRVRAALPAERELVLPARHRIAHEDAQRAGVVDAVELLGPGGDERAVEAGREATQQGGAGAVGRGDVEAGGVRAAEILVVGVDGDDRAGQPGVRRIGRAADDVLAFVGRGVGEDGVEAQTVDVVAQGDAPVVDAGAPARHRLDDQADAALRRAHRLQVGIAAVTLRDHRFAVAVEMRHGAPDRIPGAVADVDQRGRPRGVELGQRRRPETAAERGAPEDAFGRLPSQRRLRVPARAEVAVLVAPDGELGIEAAQQGHV